MVYKNLVASIVKCLTQLLERDGLTDDSRESLEVSIQCLESAYNVEVTDAIENFDILQMFETMQSNSLRCNTSEITPEAKSKAEKLKNEGNSLMRVKKYHEALDNYTKAIQLDSQNAVFYCNRAAVHSKLGNHQQAINDCNIALSIDPSYSKAYGRLGLAYTSLNKYKEAKESYEKALQLEPNNESTQRNLKIAEEKLNQPNTTPIVVGNTSSNVTNMDLSSLMSNPALMNMATHMLSDPTVQNAMSNLISGNVDQRGRMDALIQAGQQLAQQIQNFNPELIESLRQQIDRNSNDPDSLEEKDL